VGIKKGVETMSKCGCGCGDEAPPGCEYINHHNFRKNDRDVRRCPFNQQKCVERECALFNDHTYKCSLYIASVNTNLFQCLRILRRWDNSLLSIASRMLNEKRHE